MIGARLENGLGAPRCVDLARCVRRIPCPEPGVRLHLARLPDSLDEAQSCRLDAVELARLDALHRPVDRVRFLARRLLLRMVLTRAFGIEADRQHFACEDGGKPVLAGRPDLHFNLSHCDHWLLIASSRIAPVGVDIERVASDFDWQSLLRRVCSPPEIRACLGADDPCAHFFRLWSAKEAVLKARGTGLAADPRAALEGASWRALGAPPGYVAALALG